MTPGDLDTAYLAPYLPAKYESIYHVLECSGCPES
jgi:hypothetical protein